METTAVQEISWDSINELTRLQQHQEFLLKLLTNKDSFYKKKNNRSKLSILKYKTRPIS